MKARAKPTSGGRKRLPQLLAGLESRLLGTREAYCEAAEQVDDADLRALFRYNAEMRESFEKELGRLGSELGVAARAAVPGSEGVQPLGDAMHELLPEDQTERFLELCKRLEQALVDEYERLLADREFPQYVGEILRRQEKRVEAEIDHIRELECSARPTGGGADQD